ncbi:hypothetical protein [Yoonia sp. 208BN28-4]|uniref:hypothetical protein n=1 Tax=Yoonia sp. 208BN28-4 TaxID=3126505 RepID=UPI0030A07B91
MNASLEKAKTKAGAKLVFVWANSKPRVMTMLPIARALSQVGYCVFMGLPTSVDADGEEFADYADIRFLQVQTRDLHALSAIDVCIASETAIGHAPNKAIRIAVYHSLPDHALRYDYANVFKRRPQSVAESDFFCISVQQKSNDWTVDNYKDLTDNLMPVALLKYRRKTLTMVPLGYPKIDLLMSEAGTAPQLDTITYAPTQTVMAFSSVQESGGDIIGMLLENFPDHRIVFRPYPGADVDILAPMLAQFADDARFSVDTSPTGQDDMMRSAVVITDRSSIAMSYSLGLARPSVFFAIDGLGGKDPDGFAAFHPVGYRAGSIDGVKAAVKDALAKSCDIAAKIEKTRGDYIYNPGSSAAYLAQIMPDIIAGTARDEWLSLPRAPFAATDKAIVADHIKQLCAKVGPRHAATVKKLLKRAFAEQVVQPKPSFRVRVSRALRRLVKR